MKISALKFTCTNDENVTTFVEVPTLLLDSTVSMNSDSEMIQLNSLDAEFTKSIIDFAIENANNDIYAEVAIEYPELGLNEALEPLTTKTVTNFVGCSSIFMRTINTVDFDQLAFALLTFNKKQKSMNHAGGVAQNYYPVSFETIGENAILMNSILPNKK